MTQNCKLKLSHNVSVSISTEDDGTEFDLLALPDVPLLGVIQNVSLYSLMIHLPLVHSRFSSFCNLALTQNHRLILYIGDLESIQEFKCSFRIGIPFESYLIDADGKRRFNEPEIYRLHFDTLNDGTVDKLITLMPAISHLEVVISQVNICRISRLIRLLTHWASTLKWLKVCCGDIQPEDSPHFLRLIRVINLKLSFLEHLTLDLDGELFDEGNFQSTQREMLPRNTDWPILGQLKAFFFQTTDTKYLEAVCDSLALQAGEQLTEIGIGLPLAWDHYINDLVDHPLAVRFTLLATRYKSRHAFTAFPNLKGLIVNWHLSEPLNSLTCQLSSLQHLQYLELRRLSHNGKAVPVDQVALLPLPSVEILRIIFNNSFDQVSGHTVLQDAHWATLFPSVQIVNLIHIGDFCAKCYPEDGNVNYIGNPFGFSQTQGRMACLEQLLAPLTVLPSLRKIFYQRNDDLKNIAEFTGKGAFVKTHAYIY